MSTPSTSNMSRTLSTHLQKILAHTALVVAERKATADRAALERKARAHPPRGFAQAPKRQRTTGPRPAVIAELKKASPSKGLIRASFDPAWLAGRYRTRGAAARLVLTGGTCFAR